MIRGEGDQGGSLIYSGHLGVRGSLIEGDQGEGSLIQDDQGLVNY